MNVNGLMLELKTVTGLPVVPDLYKGNSDKWITFTYQDERPSFFGDNDVLADVAYISLNLFTPANYNYMSLKEDIKTYLEYIGVLTNSESYVYMENQTPIRQTIFEVQIPKEREEKESWHISG